MSVNLRESLACWAPKNSITHKINHTKVFASWKPKIITIITENQKLSLNYLDSLVRWAPKNGVTHKINQKKVFASRKPTDKIITEKSETEYKL